MELQRLNTQSSRATRWQRARFGRALGTTLVIGSCLGACQPTPTTAPSQAWTPGQGGAGPVGPGAPAAGSGSASRAPGAPAAGSGVVAPAAGSGAGPSASAASGELPARIRRLTNAELDASITSLLGVESKLAATFTPDTRQSGFTRNDAQRVDPVFMTQLDAAAKQLADMAKGKVNQLAPCNDPNAGAEACARTFLSSFVPRAYRRPATQRELDALLTVYKAGADGATYADGIAVVIQAVLESPGFLYVTELGDAQTPAAARLTDYEIASSLSYLLTGAPPDDALQNAAKAGQLQQPEMRRQHAQRLLAQPTAAAQVTRMVQEWLGIDRIAETAKDSKVYPDFEGLRPAMQKEADSFVSEVMWKQKGAVSDLFDADWTIAEDPLARMYLNLQGNAQVTRTDGHVSLSSVRRRGILSQGAFLSVYAHAHETAPVLRGVAVLRRLACFNVPAPTALNVNIVPPVSDPSKTTRERFAIHSKDAACAGCHTNIDPIGFSFEWLDGMGKERSMENNHPIDSSSQLHAGMSFDGNYTDSAALSMQLAQSPELSSCFARNLFRNAAARNTDGEGAENAYMQQTQALPAATRGKVEELLLAFVASDLFISRGAP